MLSKQTLIHIATDVVLISILFMYVNNKHKASVSAIDELREYTEEQIENVNKKLDTLVKYITKQKQRQIQSQPQTYTQPQNYTQQQPQQFSQRQPQQKQQSQPQQSQQQVNQSQQQPGKQVEKKVRFEDEPQQDIREVEEFVNAIPQRIAFVSTSFVQSNIPTTPQNQTAKIEVVEEDMEEEELNDSDMMEIEKALQAEEGDEEDNNEL